jgi:hypothetical protein
MANWWPNVTEESLYASPKGRGMPDGNKRVATLAHLPDLIDKDRRRNRNKSDTE